MDSEQPVPPRTPAARLVPLSPRGLLPWAVWDDRVSCLLEGADGARRLLGLQRSLYFYLFVVFRNRGIV